MCSARNTVFFFQAEDGIRDLVRSRGLGDVYKRQVDTEDERKGFALGAVDYVTKPISPPILLARVQTLSLIHI